MNECGDCQIAPFQRTVGKGCCASPSPRGGGGTAAAGRRWACLLKHGSAHRGSFASLPALFWVSEVERVHTRNLGSLQLHGVQEKEQRGG